MSNILVQVDVTVTPVPTGVVFGHTNLVVTDSSGVAQPFALNGSETPPWSQVVTVADGDGTLSVTAVDTTGAAIGTPVSGKFTAGTVAPTFSAPTGVTVTQL